MAKKQTARPKPKLIAEFTIFPVGVGTSVGDYVRRAYSAIQRVKGIEIEPTPMSTIIEAGSLEKIQEVVQKAHSALLKAGAQRIYMVLKVDDRRDKPHSGKHKIARMTDTNVRC